MSRINIITLSIFGGVLIWIFLFSPGTIQVIQRGALAVFSPFMSSSEKLERAVDEFGDDGRSPRELRMRLDVLERESAEGHQQIIAKYGWREHQGERHYGFDKSFSGELAIRQKSTDQDAYRQ